jgi:hypothetical protein
MAVCSFGDVEEAARLVISGEAALLVVVISGEAALLVVVISGEAALLVVVITGEAALLVVVISGEAALLVVSACYTIGILFSGRLITAGESSGSSREHWDHVGGRAI